MPSAETDSDCTVLKVGSAIESNSFIAVSEGCAASVHGNLRAERLSGIETVVDEVVAASCAAPESAKNSKARAFSPGRHRSGEVKACCSEAGVVHRDSSVCSVSRIRTNSHRHNSPLYGSASSSLARVRAPCVSACSFRPAQLLRSFCCVVAADARACDSVHNSARN